MEYIELKFKYNDDESAKTYSFEEIIKYSDMIILLGSPGSGKTSTLKYYNTQNKYSQFVTARNFMKESFTLEANTSLLLLDSVDEYRASTIDCEKDYVIENLAEKVKFLLKRCPILKFVLSCRDIEWYDEQDKKTLPERNETIRVLPLNRNQQYMMLQLKGIKEPQKIIEQLSDKGFLNNPQLLGMISDILKNNIEISNITNIYKEFISLAKEHNAPKYIKDQRNALGEDNRLKIIGYLAAYTILCGIESFTDDIIDSIVDSDTFTKDNIELVLNTSIFDNRKFIHRTIAEYSLAKYLLENKLTDNLSKERILNMFVTNTKIPSHLKGTYAWLSSISHDSDFFEKDPYYFFINGDYSDFSYDNKIELLEVLKIHAENFSFRCDYWSEKKQGSKFYSPKLDEKLINDLYDSQGKNINYVEIINDIIINGEKLSSNIIENLKEFILDPKVIMTEKLKFLNHVKFEPPFLIKVLNEVIASEEKLKSIKKDDFSKGDRETLFDFEERGKILILNKLYPNFIKPDEIAKYLDFSNLYNNAITSPYKFLLKTPVDKHNKLIEKFTKLQGPMKTSEKSKFSDFIEFYCYEVIRQYKSKYSAEEIYIILKKIRPYYSASKKIKAPYRKGNRVDLELSDLGDKIFELYLLEQYSEIPIEIHFDNLCEYIKVDNYSKAYLNVVDKLKKKEYKLQVLKVIYNNRKDLNLNEDYFSKKVEELEAIDIWKSWINSRGDAKSSIENKRNSKSSYLEALDEQVSQLSDEEEIRNNLDTLKELAKYLSVASFKKEDLKSKNIIKNYIFSKNNELKELKLSSLVCNPIEKFENIDYVYYSSLILNENNFNQLFIHFKNETELKKYIFILSLKARIQNLKESNFIDLFEKKDPDFCYKVLQEFLIAYLERHEKDINLIILNRISEEHNYEVLKEIFRNLKFIQEFFGFYITHYFLELSNTELNAIKKYNEEDLKSKKLNIWISFLISKTVSDFDKTQTIDLFLLFYNRNDPNFKNLNALEPKIRHEVLIQLIQYVDFHDTREMDLSYPIALPVRDEDDARSFLKRHSLVFLPSSELSSLFKKLKETEKIDREWLNHVKVTLSNKLQKEADEINNDNYNIKGLKSFLLKNSILSESDFFHDVINSLKKLAKEIEGNRNNEKDGFYSEEKEKAGRNEEFCRDRIVEKLKDKYMNYKISREQYEANNRVDFNICYAKNNNFEVQVECKLDKNRELFKGINNQIIPKYLEKKVDYGIYLVFFFQVNKTPKDEIIKKLELSIPQEYRERIEVILIDLT